MNRLFSLLLLLYTISLPSLFSQDCGATILVNETNFEDSYRTIEKYEDGLILAGQYSNSPAISYYDQSFNLIQSFELASLIGYTVVGLHVDESIVYAACISSDLFDTYVLKVDLETETILWSKRISHFDRIQPYQEMFIHQDRLFVIGRIDDIGLGCDGLVLGFNKDDGELEVQSANNLGSCETFIDNYYREESFYTTGRHNNAGGGQSEMRPALTKFDLDGNLEWSKLYLESTNNAARLYARSFLEKDDQFYFAAHGDYNGTSTINTNLIVFKTDIDGNIVDHNYFESSTSDSHVSVDNIEVSDGIVVVSTYRETTTLRKNILISKYDFDGNFITAISVDIGTLDTPTKIINIGSNLFLTGNTNNDQFMIKISTNLLDNLGCTQIEEFELNQFDGPLIESSSNLIQIPTDLENNSESISLSNIDFYFEIVCQAEMTNEGFIDFQICEEDEIFVNGQIYNEAGDYNQSLTSANGCDSTLFITIELEENTESFQDYLLCQGDEIIINGQVYTELGDYTQSFTNANGCDSTLFILIEHDENIESFIDYVLCDGEEVIINGQVYNQSGEYSQVIENLNGCDTILNVYVDVVETFTDVSFIDLCPEETIQINGEIYGEAGTFTQTFSTSENCDSTLILNINIRPDCIDCSSSNGLNIQNSSISIYKKNSISYDVKLDLFGISNQFLNRDLEEVVEFLTIVRLSNHLEESDWSRIFKIKSNSLISTVSEILLKQEKEVQKIIKNQVENDLTTIQYMKINTSSKHRIH